MKNNEKMTIIWWIFLSLICMFVLMHMSFEMKVLNVFRFLNYTCWGLQVCKLVKHNVRQQLIWLNLPKFCCLSFLTFTTIINRCFRVLDAFCRNMVFSEITLLNLPNKVFFIISYGLLHQKQMLLSRTA